MSATGAKDDTIYLDHAATTPVDPDVLAVMLPYFSGRFGNPSSIYRLGQEAHAALDQARGSIAEILGCGPSEIVFTSGATESDNLALTGTAWQARNRRSPDDASPHIVTTAIEHHAVLHAAEQLERRGFAVTYVQPGADGVIAIDAVAAAIRPETRLISVMYANNETGAIQPVAAIGAIAKARGIPFHIDAVQAAGLLPLRVDELGADLLSLSAHKFYGPKGVGLLYVRRATPIEFQQRGGGQESGRRGGTENVPGIVGMAAALEKATWLRNAYATHCAGLRDRLLEGLREAIPDLAVNGPLEPAKRLPNNLNVAIPGVQGETALLSLDMEGVAASAGSACTTGNSEPSHVLRAMGLPDELCRASLRFTVGRDNTINDIDETIDIVSDVAVRIRGLAGVA
ncbi:MAG TPA: cysteine desulfurase family protein [Thermomicrobiales bacterium]|nr:cysteine desulfurase family protein [Thermomicrobiales bacterium]